MLASAPLGPALDALRDGRMAVVFDGRRGDLVVAADRVDAEAVTFMALHARGLVSLALTPERCAALALRPVGGSSWREEFTVSIEAREGVDTGISAADRARTIAVAADPACGRDDLVRPGHVFPIRTRPGGVLERAACPEAAVDLVRAAGSHPAAAICTVLDEHGATAGLDELLAFCERHELPLARVEEVVAQRVADESRVERVASRRVRAGRGWWEASTYRSLPDGGHQVVATTGRVVGGQDVPAHVRTGCLDCDVLGSTGCDCGARLEDALATIARESTGILVELPAGGERETGLAAAAAIVAQLGPSSVAVVHGAPDLVVALARAGVRAQPYDGPARAAPAARELPRLLAATDWTASGGFN